MISLIISISGLSLAFITGFLLLFKRSQGAIKMAFTFAIIFTTLSVSIDSLCVLYPEYLDELKRIGFISEVIMALMWLIFSIKFARKRNGLRNNIPSLILILLSPVLISLPLFVSMDRFYYAPDFLYERILFMKDTGFLFIIGLLAYYVLSMINLEVTLRSSSGIDRWKIKYTLLGAGGILSVSFFYYSYSLLYRSLNMNFTYARASVILISLAIIFYSLMRQNAFDTIISISRNIIYKSLALIIVGVYLLGLGIIGAGMRYLGPDVGNNITAIIGFLGAFAVLTILLSEKLRRKAIVFINKNFFRHKYDYRQQWLDFTAQISGKCTLEELLDAILKGFVNAMGSRGAAIWLKETESEKFICMAKTFEEEITCTPPDAMLNFLTEKKWVIDVNDPGCKDICESAKEFIKSTRASLIVPLFSRDQLFGFIVLRSGLVEDEYNYEDYDLLKTLASQASAEILSNILNTRLIESKQMEIIGKISSFLVHDLKNSVSGLSLMIQNVDDYIDDPDFQRDMIKTIKNTTKKIESTIEKLKNISINPDLNLEDNDIVQCVKSVVRDFNNLNNGKERIKISIDGPESLIARFDRDAISKVMINLIKNAVDAISYEGNIKIQIGSENGMAFIKVKDNGCGMSEDFIRSKLFRPFSTTKKKGFGIGLYQCREMIRAHGGEIKVESKEGEGSEFSIYIPLK